MDITEIIIGIIMVGGGIVLAIYAIKRILKTPSGDTRRDRRRNRRR